MKLCCRCNLREATCNHGYWCAPCKLEYGRVYNTKRLTKGICVICGDNPRYKKGVRCLSCKTKIAEDRKLLYDSNKLKAINYLGKKCIDCGLDTIYTSVYDFHHLDPTKKSEAISQMFRKQWEDFIEELNKCVLLCANCHRIRHTLEGLPGRKEL